MQHVGRNKRRRIAPICTVQRAPEREISNLLARACSAARGESGQCADAYCAYGAEENTMKPRTKEEYVQIATAAA